MARGGVGRGRSWICVTDFTAEFAGHFPVVVIDEHFTQPFVIGWANPAKNFVEIKIYDATNVVRDLECLIETVAYVGTWGRLHLQV
jgi:hypothetical protein